jgi:hypothetical protein
MSDKSQQGGMMEIRWKMIEEEDVAQGKRREEDEKLEIKRIHDGKRREEDVWMNRKRIHEQKGGG